MSPTGAARHYTSHAMHKVPFMFTHKPSCVHMAYNAHIHARTRAHIQSALITVQMSCFRQQISSKP